MALEVFHKEDPSIKQVCTEATEHVQEARHEENKAERVRSVTQANTNLLDFLADDMILKKFQDWEKQKSRHAMLEAIMNHQH